MKKTKSTFVLDKRICIKKLIRSNLADMGKIRKFLKVLYNFTKNPVGRKLLFQKGSLFDTARDLQPVILYCYTLANSASRP